MRFDLREVPFVEADEEINGNGALRLRVTATTTTGCRFGGNVGGATETRRNVEREEAEAAGSGDG